MLWQLVAIAIGGAVGACLRFLVAQALSSDGFPWATFAVNVVGCFGLTLVIGVLESRLTLAEPVRLAIVTGFFGALTTFSTFSYEIWRLYDRGDMLTALVYLTTSIGMGLFMSMLGITLGRAL